MSYIPPTQQPYFPPGQPMSPMKGPRQYSLFGAMLRAPLFSGSLYRDVARNWTGINFWFLVLLELVTWIIVLVKMHLAVAAFNRNQFPTVVQDVPPMTITNGHVTSPVTQPYYINDPDTKKPIFALDTTGKINSLDDTDAVVLVTDHRVYARQNDGGAKQVRQYDLTPIKNFYVDKNRVIGWMNKFSQWFAIGLLPFMVIGAVVLRLIQMLIYGGINMAFSAGFNANLSYAAALRLAVLAITPVILLDPVLDLCSVHIPFWALLGILIELAYMTVAVRANANATPTAPPPGFPVSMPQGYAQPYQPPMT